jgi:sodium/pantothenate symporter
MDRNVLAWVLFGVYAIATVLLSLRGMKKTQSFAVFALGNRDMGPVMVGITLAAAIASTATFVINPGFVYAHGVSALMHLGLGASAGATLALILFSRGFRRMGESSAALTLPHWIGNRFGNHGMRSYFALLNLVLAVSFVVLIVKGSALVMQHTLGLGYVASVLLIVAFVFGYILLGGTYAHVYTNAFQGAMMVVVAIAIVGSGIHLFGDGVGAFVDRIAAQDPALVQIVNSESPLFGSVWDVFVCAFVVGAGLMCQPHILVKSMYLKSERDLSRYLAVAIVVGVVFALVLVAGLYARLTLTSVPSQDAVMPIYLSQAFGPVVGVVVSVALLAAGMSTLDGVLVSASTIAANDVILGPLGARWLSEYTDGEKQRLALRSSRWVLVAMGVASAAVALDPPELVGIFAQVGIYGLVAASLAPMTYGIFAREVDGREAFVAALVGPAIHFGVYLGATYGAGTFVNPASTATMGVLGSFGALGVMMAIRCARARRTLAVGVR